MKDQNKVNPSRIPLQTALTTLQQLENTEQDDYYTKFNMGCILIESKQYREAISYFEQLMQDPVIYQNEENEDENNKENNSKNKQLGYNDYQKGLAMYHVGFCYDRLGNTEVATIYYRQSLELNPMQKNAIINYSKLIVKKGENTLEAQDFLEKYLQVNPNDEEVLVNLNIILAKQGDHTKLKHLFNNILLQKIPEPTTLYNHGVFLHQTNRYKSALECFLKILDLHKEQKVEVNYQILLQTHVNIAIIYEQIRKPLQSLNMFKQIIKKFKEDPLVLKTNFTPKIKFLQDKLAFQNLAEGKDEEDGIFENDDDTSNSHLENGMEEWVPHGFLKREQDYQFKQQLIQKQQQLEQEKKEMKLKEQHFKQILENQKYKDYEINKSHDQSKKMLEGVYSQTNTEDDQKNKSNIKSYKKPIKSNQVFGKGKQQKKAYLSQQPSNQSILEKRSEINKDKNNLNTSENSIQQTSYSFTNKNQNSQNNISMSNKSMVDTNYNQNQNKIRNYNRPKSFSVEQIKKKQQQRKNNENGKQQMHSTMNLRNMQTTNIQVLIQEEQEKQKALKQQQEQVSPTFQNEQDLEQENENEQTFQGLNPNPQLEQSNELYNIFNWRDFIPVEFEEWDFEYCENIIEQAEKDFENQESQNNLEQPMEVISELENETSEYQKQSQQNQKQKTIQSVQNQQEIINNQQEQQEQQENNKYQKLSQQQQQKQNYELAMLRQILILFLNENYEASQDLLQNLQDKELVVLDKVYHFLNYLMGIILENQLNYKPAIECYQACFDNLESLNQQNIPDQIKVIKKIESLLAITQNQEDLSFYQSKLRKLENEQSNINKSSQSQSNLFSQHENVLLQKDLKMDNVMYWKEGIPKEVFKWTQQDCDANIKINGEYSNLRMFFIEKDEQKDYEMARFYLSKLQLDSPKFKTDAILFFMGMTYYEENNYEKALENFEKCFSNLLYNQKFDVSNKNKQQQYVILLLKLSECHTIMNHYLKSMKFLSKAKQILSYAHLEDPNFEDSDDEFLQIPKHDFIEENILNWQQDISSSFFSLDEETCHQAGQEDQVLSNLKLFMCEYKQKEYDIALSYLQKVQIIDNTFKPQFIAYLIGLCYIQTKNYENALQYLLESNEYIEKSEDLLQNKEDDPIVFNCLYNNLSLCYFKLGQKLKSQQFYRKIQNEDDFTEGSSSFIEEEEKQDSQQNQENQKQWNYSLENKEKYKEDLDHSKGLIKSFLNQQEQQQTNSQKQRKNDKNIQNPKNNNNNNNDTGSNKKNEQKSQDAQRNYSFKRTISVIEDTPLKKQNNLLDVDYDQGDYDEKRSMQDITTLVQSIEIKKEESIISSKDNNKSLQDKKKQNKDYNSDNQWNQSQITHNNENKKNEQNIFKSDAKQIYHVNIVNVNNAQSEKLESHFSGLENTGNKYQDQNQISNQQIQSNQIINDNNNDKIKNTQNNQEKKHGLKVETNNSNFDQNNISNNSVTQFNEEQKSQTKKSEQINSQKQLQVQSDSESLIKTPQITSYTVLENLQDGQLKKQQNTEETKENLYLQENDSLQELNTIEQNQNYKQLENKINNQNIDTVNNLLPVEEINSKQKINEKHQNQNNEQEIQISENQDQSQQKNVQQQQLQKQIQKTSKNSNFNNQQESGKTDQKQNNIENTKLLQNKNNKQNQNNINDNQLQQPEFNQHIINNQDQINLKQQIDNASPKSNIKKVDQDDFADLSLDEILDDYRGNTYEQRKIQKQQEQQQKQQNQNNNEPLIQNILENQIENNQNTKNEIKTNIIYDYDYEQDYEADENFDQKKSLDLNQIDQQNQNQLIKSKSPTELTQKNLQKLNNSKQNLQNDQKNNVVNNNFNNNTITNPTNNQMFKSQNSQYTDEDLEYMDKVEMLNKQLGIDEDEEQYEENQNKQETINEDYTLQDSKENSKQKYVYEKQKLDTIQETNTNMEYSEILSNKYNNTNPGSLQSGQSQQWQIQKESIQKSQNELDFKKNNHKKNQNENKNINSEGYKGNNQLKEIQEGLEDIKLSKSVNESPQK